MSRYINVFPQHFDFNGAPLAGYTVYFGVENLDPKLNPKQPFSDPELTVALPASRVLDEDGAYGIDYFLKGSYSLRIEDTFGALWRETPSFSGTLSGSLDSIADLRGIGGDLIADNAVVVVTGYYVTGDGGGGDFYWNEASTDADDGGVTILPDGHSGAGRWKRIFDGAVNLRWFGSVSDGTTDNSSTIQAAFDYAKSDDKAIEVSGGVFAHEEVINIDSIEVYGDGEFRGTSPVDPPTNAVRLTGAAPSLKGVKVTTDYTGSRVSANNSTAVYVDAATEFVVDGITVEGGASAGIFVSNGSSYGMISNNKVSDTLADGIHHTNGSNNIVTHSNLVSNTGDDGIAVVGYNISDLPFGINIYGNRIDTTLARGITCVGGKHVVIQGNTIEETFAAGILIGSDAGFNTRAAEFVMIDGNKLLNCVTGLSSHTGILFSGRSGFPITNTVVSNNVIEDDGTVATVIAMGIKVANEFTEEAIIRDNKLLNTGSSGITVSGQNPQVIANVVHTVTGSTIVVAADTIGEVMIDGNRTINPATGGATNRAHIDVTDAVNLTACIITDNHMIDGDITPDDPIRYLSATSTQTELRNFYNGQQLADVTAIPKVGNDYIVDLTSNRPAFSGNMEITNLNLLTTETIQFKILGDKLSPLNIRFMTVKSDDQNQWRFFYEIWYFITSGPSGVSGIDYIALTGGGFYQRTDLNNASNGLNAGDFTIAETDSGIDEVTVTFTPGPNDQGVRVSLDWVRKAS